MNAKTLYREALALPPDERAQLVEQLLDSLDDLPEAEIERLWFEEAGRRAMQTDQGKVQRLPAEAVLKEARALLK